MLPFDVLRMVKSTTGGGSGGGSGVSTTIDASASKFRLGIGQATASFSLNSDGTCTIVSTGGPSFWYDPVTAGIGASYWAIVTLTEGAVTSGTIGSRVQLTSGHTWSLTTTGSEVYRNSEAIGTIQIWDAASGGNMVGSGTFYLYAEVDNS